MHKKLDFGTIIRQVVEIVDLGSRNCRLSFFSLLWFYNQTKKGGYSE
jgi:hypothetical protein